MPFEDKRDSRAHAVAETSMEIHDQPGCGFLEAIYQKALQQKLPERDVPFRRKVHIPVFYKGARLNAEYGADFVCYDSVIVELKAFQRLAATKEAQVINYLKATCHEVALLLNFWARSLEYRHFIFSKSVSSVSSVD